MRFRKSIHAVYNTQYHIVWTPRYRRRIINKRCQKTYLEKLLRNLEGLREDIEVKKVNVQEELVHVVVVIPPRVLVAQVVQYMKNQTGNKNKRKV